MLIFFKILIIFTFLHKEIDSNRGRQNPNLIPTDHPSHKKPRQNISHPKIYENKNSNPQNKENPQYENTNTNNQRANTRQRPSNNIEKPIPKIEVIKEEAEPVPVINIDKQTEMLMKHEIKKDNVKKEASLEDLGIISNQEQIQNKKEEFEKLKNESYFSFNITKLANSFDFVCSFEDIKEISHDLHLYLIRDLQTFHKNLSIYVKYPYDLLIFLTFGYFISKLMGLICCSRSNLVNY